MFGWYKYINKVRRANLLYKRNRIFRLNFLKYKKYYKDLSEERRIIELDLIEHYEKNFTLFYQILFMIIGAFITLFIPFQINTLISGNNAELYGWIIVIMASVALFSTFFLFIILLFLSAHYKYYLSVYALFLIIWLIILFSPMFDQFIMFHLILSIITFITLMGLAWWYLGFEKEVLLARKLAINLGHTSCI
jgi:hypothetical protein